jgi:hypothetical protein
MASYLLTFPTVRDGGDPYQHPPLDDQLGIRIDSEGGSVEPLRLAKPGST